MPNRETALLCFGGLLLLLVSEALAEPPRKADQKTAGQAATNLFPADPALYAGVDTCKACHDQQEHQYQRSPHAATLHDKRGPQWQGCEACHGPGKAHAEAGGDKTKIVNFTSLSREESARRCLRCHQFAREQTEFLRSEHLKNQVGCIDCHSVHHARVERVLLKNSQPLLCYACHITEKSAFSKPFHHRVNEGLVACSDCHNPHGAALARQLRASVSQDAVCFKCHVDKQGPFAFEHAPVKTEGCVSCHTPHGSSNPRLLKRSQVNLLCLECHTLTVDSVAPGIPSFHNQAQKYQACTMCHVAVHGSNSDAFLFKP